MLWCINAIILNKKNKNSESDGISMKLYVHCLDDVKDFRIDSLDISFH